MLLLVIAYTPVGQRLFGTAPIEAIAWLFVLPFAGAVVVAEEVRKWIVRVRFGGWVPGG